MRNQRFLDINEAIKSRRSERMLAPFGLIYMTSEPIMRERMEYDTAPHRVDEFFTPIEREGLMVKREMFREKGGDTQCLDG